MKTKNLKLVQDFLGILFGSFITALALVAFLIPNKIAAGGVSGLATIIHYLMAWPVGIVMLAFEIPLFLLSVRHLGFGFGMRTLLGALSLPIFIDTLTLSIEPVTSNIMLASLYGGIVAGIGIGIVFRFKGSTGGTDEAAALVHKFIPVPVGQILLVIDGMVILAAAYFFGLEAALYALITVFVTSKMIDIVQEGLSVAKAALIISPKTQEIAKGIMEIMDRGATGLSGKGMYTGYSRDVLLSVVSQSEVSRLKEVVYNIDPKAFVIVADVHEVLGEGFKKWN